MKILYVLQQSIYQGSWQNGDLKWLSADSNINMFAGAVSELLRLTDWKFDVLVGMPFGDIKNMKEILKDDRVNYIEYHYPIDSLLSRYHFDSAFIGDVLLESQPDVIWNNIPELTRNFKSLLKTLKMSHVKVVNCNYWMDTPGINEGKVDDEQISYSWRQIDGALAADLVPFTCESTRVAFLHNIQVTLASGYIQKLMSKNTIWDFGFSMREMKQYQTPETFKKKTILFPNRLSGINYTHHQEFIQAVNSLADKRNDFQVVFTNPSQKVAWKWLKENVKPLHIYDTSVLSREKYVKLLHMSDIVVSLYDIERYGGCANVEAIFCNCLPVMTKYGEYMTRAPSDYQYFVDLPVTAEKIEKALDAALNDKYYKNSARFNADLISRITKSSYEQSARKVISDIDRLFKED